MKTYKIVYHYLHRNVKRQQEAIVAATSISEAIKELKDTVDCIVDSVTRHPGAEA